LEKIAKKIVLFLLFLIITEYYETNTMSVLGVLVTGRSGKNSYNNNQKAEEIYPGDSKRVIKLTGYYK